MPTMNRGTNTNKDQDHVVLQLVSRLCDVCLYIVIVKAQAQVGLIMNLQGHLIFDRSDSCNII